MSLAEASRRGWALNALLFVKGIQKSVSLRSMVLLEDSSRRSISILLTLERLAKRRRTTVKCDNARHLRKEFAMRLSKARIATVQDAELSLEQRELLAPMAARGRILNIFRTLVREPSGLKAFLAWGNYILSRGNGLPPREREIVILRTGYLCRSGYEWTQHVSIGKRAGLTDDEIAKIKLGADAQGWSDADAALIRASDELHADQFIGDETWAALGKHYNDKQRMDVVFTAGQYTQVSMILNSFGVQLDEGQTLDPDLRDF
jgi:alkylhydroperoxidase family enzyme